MAKYQVETEKGSFTLNGSSATAVASALLVKLNNQRANGYKINGSYGDNMFSVVLVDKDKKPFKEYYLKKVGKTQDKQSPKLWQIDIQNKKTKRAARTFFCFAENGSEANNKARKALKMLGEGYELANAPHHIATKGDGQAEQYLKSGIKIIDKSPLSFMDSVVRAFRDSENKYYRVVLRQVNRGFSDLINCVVFANNKVEAGQKALSYYKNKYKADMKKGSMDFILLKVAEHENQKIAKANI